MNKVRIFGLWFIHTIRLVWDALTQHATRCKDETLPVFSSWSAIIDHLQWGRLWTADPSVSKLPVIGWMFRGKRGKKAVLDTLFHATHSEKKLRTKDPTISMDCDDHMIYWAQALIRSKLAKSCKRAEAQFTYPDGTQDGHSITVFEDFDGKWYWADYNNPIPIEGPWGFMDGVSAEFGVKMRYGVLTEITGLTKDARVKFGRVHVRLGNAK